MTIVRPSDEVRTSLDLTHVKRALELMAPRQREEAIYAIVEVFLRAAASLIYSADGTSWEDSDSEGRVVVTFEADAACISILDVSFVDAATRMGTGRFVVNALGQRRYFPLPSRKGPSAALEARFIICIAIGEIRAKLPRLLRARFGLDGAIVEPDTMKTIASGVKMLEPNREDRIEIADSNLRVSSLSSVEGTASLAGLSTSDDPLPVIIGPALKA